MYMTGVASVTRRLATTETAVDISRVLARNAAADWLDRISITDSAVGTAVSVQTGAGRD
jgi:hypothetical protein